jgi:hypothetical protein
MDDPILTFVWLMTTYIVYNFVWSFIEGYRQFANEETREELIDKLNEIVHIVETEKRGDMFYWFDQDSGQFLGQGTCDDEIIKVLKSRFPEHMFYISKDDKNHLLSANTEWEMWHVSGDLTKIQ